MDTTKIIKGVVNSGRYTVTAPIVKEDYGLYLQIEGVELPSTYEVDFSNDEHHGTSVTMIGNADGVLIPHQFIDTGKDVFAFLYHVGANYGRTVYKFRIPNKVRPDRTDDTPTPEEQSVIDQAINALNSAVAQTAQDVIDAAASASAASQSESNAHDSELAAHGYANDASGYASDAQGYATTASQKATAAGNSADQAAQIKTDIEGYVSTAQGYAQTATDKAAQASQSATNASNSATTASTKAGEASASATTASNKASEASGYASTASAKATEASQSASQALTYKNDAESAKTASQTAQGKAEDAQTAAETAQGLAEDARDEAQTLVDGITGKVEQIDSNTERIESLEDDRYKPYAVDSASGSIASFTDGADDLPLKSLIVNIDPVQDTSSGDPSPENICPISGWTEVDVEQRGKNLFDKSVVEVGALKADGTVQVTVSTKYVSGYIRISPNTSYYLSNVIPATDGRSGFWYDADKNPIEAIIKSPYTLTSFAVVSPSNAEYVRIGCYIASADICQLEAGSTATPYEPYAGRSITIQLGQTVYGGKLDVLSGELVIDRAMVDLGTLDWVYRSTGYNTKPFYAPLTNALLPPQSSVIIPALCSMYSQIAPNKMNTPTNDKCFGIGHYFSGQHEIQILDTAYTDATAFKAAVTGQTLVYKLAEPITIQLTPSQINSLYGVNNIWADTGDTACEYRADTKLYINRLTEPDADMIADSNIVSGQYFMVGNNLYKATANIASGASVIVGTNAVRKSLSEALNEINA